ncbi:hypothetical protein BJX99DRAFT_43983 [Aspergillus californicus]
MVLFLRYVQHQLLSLPRCVLASFAPITKNDHVTPSPHPFLTQMTCLLLPITLLGSPSESIPLSILLSLCHIYFPFSRKLRSTRFQFSLQSTLKGYWDCGNCFSGRKSPFYLSESRYIITEPNVGSFCHIYVVGSLESFPPGHFRPCLTYWSWSNHIFFTSSFYLSTVIEAASHFAPQA